MDVIRKLVLKDDLHVAVSSEVKEVDGKLEKFHYLTIARPDSHIVLRYPMSGQSRIVLQGSGNLLQEKYLLFVDCELHRHDGGFQSSKAERIARINILDFSVDRQFWVLPEAELEYRALSGVDVDSTGRYVLAVFYGTEFPDIKV